MFYVKEKLGNGTVISVEISDENVYTNCPVCMEEMRVDLSDVLKDGDLYATQVLCADCSNRYENGEFGKREDFHIYLSKLHDKEAHDEKTV